MAGYLDYGRRMTARRLLISSRWSLSSLVASPALGARRQPPGPPTFKSSVESSRSRPSSGTARAGSCRDLTRSRTSSSSRRASEADPGFPAEADGPVKLDCSMDASGSMRVGSKAVDARQAARTCSSALRGRRSGGAVLVRHAAGSGVATSRRTSRRWTRRSARSNTPYGQTSLYDAIAEAARGGRRARAQRRPACAADRRWSCSPTAIDTHSRPHHGAGGGDRQRDRRAGLRHRGDVADRRPEGRRDAALRCRPGCTQLARSTGGEMFTASAPAHASVAARQIVGELRHQYVLAFEASTHERAGAGWKCAARDPKWIVRARRTGYPPARAGGPRQLTDAIRHA